MNKIKKIYLIGLALLFSITTFSQTVKGVVYAVSTSNEREALPYASVYWTGTTQVVVTDEKGQFSIALPSGKNLPQTLAASFLGHINDTVMVLTPQQEIVLNLYEGATLEEVIIRGRTPGNYFSRLAPLRTEIISAAGLCKMACCNLAESFENSATISVGYSDAITGARQIRLLGLSGIYTQMLDENRPIMRGLSSPFGLSYTPGQWLESIQIAKGVGAVTNGYEAITGQINLEHRKPSTEQPFFLNAYMDTKLRTELNIASSLQLSNKWATAILAHGSVDLKKQDHNHDGFLDEPLIKQINLANRWLYLGDNGSQLRFGVKGLYETRDGGQMNFDKTRLRDTTQYGSNIENKQFNAYLKFGIPLAAHSHLEEALAAHEAHEAHEGHEAHEHEEIEVEASSNIAFVLDYTFHELNSFYGLKKYDGRQNSVFANVMLQLGADEHHRYIFGLSGRFDDFNEQLNDVWFDATNTQQTYMWFPGRREWVGGAFGEYTYLLGDKFTAIAGFRADYNSKYQWLITPRVNLKYALIDDIILRASAGRGFRTANVIADNIGILATGREIIIENNLKIEDAWTYGASLSFYFKLFREEKSSLSFDYFRTDFANQVLVDQEMDWSRVWVYNLDGKSYTNTYQIDFNTELVKRFTMFATFRYSDAQTTYLGNRQVERPLVDEYKGVLNLQYGTRMYIWTFDFTAQINGRSRLPNFMPDAYSPVYPMFFAQITRKFKGVDVYAGCENIFDYMQEHPIISADRPYSPQFNSSVIWGPLMGRKLYAGLRWTIFK